ncbi:Epidermal growth factor receptor kinase substrate 8 [Stylophora pistillata]|uniref:Epidermal growth factor receptor kinase substrate 8 n=1 Tax=Stylophora pistillata TaxID=50429 RepID=A0A2B4SMH9_STYPI|nr:Epidermal growth factor receptor kinase substrate 8 [Stylophora pistillata]
MNGDIGRRGDSSPTDSGVDTREWEETHRAGPRMSLEPYNYGSDSSWSNLNGVEVKKNGSYKGKALTLNNNVDPRKSPKNSPKLGVRDDNMLGNEDQQITSVYLDKYNPIREGETARISGKVNQRSGGAVASWLVRSTLDRVVRHLSSFTLKTPQEAQVPAKERLQQTKELLAKGNQWTKEMEMRLTDTDVVLLDGETQDVVEVFSLTTVGHVHHFTDDPDLNSVLVFNTLQTENKFAAMHLFQSDRVPAAVVATEIMKASSSKAAMPNKFAAKGGAILPPPPSHPAPPPPTEVDQERLDLYGKSLVAQTIAAFSAVSDNSAKKTGKPQVSSRYQAGESSSDIPDETMSAELLEARTNRDVQILNHCIDDIEDLVMRTKRSAEAWRKLQKKKGKVKQSSLTLEARPPPEAEFYDAFQKLKHALNLLGKLRQHIHNPNAAELVHYLFVPLSLLIRCTGGPEKARAVILPLLTTQAIDLLQNCLSSKETELWMALGPNWTLPKSSKQFKDQFMAPYTPMFKDGWTPPEVIAGKDVSNLSAAIAANAANAAAVAQLNDGSRKGDDSAANFTNSAVISAAAKFRRLASVKGSSESPPPSPPKKGLRRVRVLYDFQARNSKELTVHQGEEVANWRHPLNTKSVNTCTAVILPSPPSTAPPPIPTAMVATSQTLVQKTETATVSSSPPGTVSESPKIPHVELRPVGMAKQNRPVSAPPSHLVITPAAPTSQAPSSPPQPTTPPPVILKTVNGAQKEKVSSTDMLNDELKRRMTHSQGGLTPRAQRKDAQTVNLTPDSNAKQVKEWLKSKDFSDSCVAALSGKSAKDMEAMTKDQLSQACGDADGARVYSQFSVQKASWKATNKGSELAFIMQKRKERSEEKEEPNNDGELRIIVADAKAAAAKEETEIRQRTSSTGKKTNKPGAPPPKPRPKSFAGPEVRPRTNTKTDQNTQQEASFDSEFIPPPPVLDAEDQPTSKEESLVARKISVEDVQSIMQEQKKQQELLMEHDKTLFLLEQLQRQKLELEQQKREFEEQQQKLKQAELQEQQKELHRQIQAQQDQLKMNEGKLVQQQRLLSNYENIPAQYTYSQIPPVMPQMPVMPLAGVGTGAPAYLPMGGLRPMYSAYPGAMTQPGVTHMVPSMGVPSLAPTQPPTQG